MFKMNFNPCFIPNMNMPNIIPNLNMNRMVPNINFNNMGNINVGNVNNNIGNMLNIGGVPSNNMNFFGANNINCNFINKIQSPIRAIHNFCSPMNCSYANSVLQSLACLDCIKKWYTQLNQLAFMKMNNIPNSITKLFYNLLYVLYIGNQPDSSTIIFQYYEKMKQLQNKVPKADSFHFLFYFLDLLHFENNNIMNLNFNINEYNNPSINNMTNENYMYMLYQNYFKSTQNSFISYNFFNTFKYQVKCSNNFMNCPSLYRYKCTKIIQFDIDNYRKYRDEAIPNRKNKNLNLEECLSCFQGGVPGKCSNCGSYNTMSYSNLWHSNKVLIFSFKRVFHSFNCDIDFGMKIDMSKYTKTNMHGNIKNIYNLKACISLYNYNKYFADVMINGNWFRYMDCKFKTLCYNEVYIYEPQLLIYELEEPQNFIPNINGFFNPFNMIKYQQMLANLGNFQLMMQNYNFLKGI